jgi:hypothetical protein
MKSRKESNTHTHTHSEQQNGRNYHMPFNINAECQWSQLPNRNMGLWTGLKRKTQWFIAYNDCISLTKTTGTFGDRVEIDFPRKWTPKSGSRSSTYIW